MRGLHTTTPPPPTYRRPQRQRRSPSLSGSKARCVKKLATSIPRIALTPPEAAASIGVGPDFFEEHVAPELRLIRRGRKRLVPVTELERWSTENAAVPVAVEVSQRER